MSLSQSKALTLTLVIPAYNEEDHLLTCLESIAAQTTAPDAVVVVDNNSTDATATVAGQFPFVTLLREPRQGIVHARNKGFDSVKTDIIGRIDADTVLPTDWVEKVLLRAVRYGSDTAVTGPCHFQGVLLPGAAYWLHRVIYFWSSRFLFGHPILFGSNMFMFRAQWQKVRQDICLRTDVHEDMDLAHHLVGRGYKIRFDANFQATISNRRFHNWGHYPAMWLRSRLVHLRRSKR